MELNALRERNMKKLREIEQAGVHIDPVMLLKLRLDVLTNFLFREMGENEEERRDYFEREWEATMSSMLDDAEKAVTRSKLLAR